MFRRLPYSALLCGIKMSGPHGRYYWAEVDGLSVPGLTPKAALVRLFRTVAGDIDGFRPVSVRRHV